MTKIKGYKGFNADWTCRGFQYEVGKTYEHKGVVGLCTSGFHACVDIRDVWRYYGLAGSRFAQITAEGVSAQKDDDSKFVCAKITIDKEISLSDMIELVVKETINAANKDNGNHSTAYKGAASATGDWGAASATGYRGAASATGDWGAASATGYKGAASAIGEQGAAVATGYKGAASATGYKGAASAIGEQGAAVATGDRGAASATGYRGAASATGYRGAASATGYRGVAVATGEWGAAVATGDWGAAMASWRFGAAMASGFDGRASGTMGNALFLVERNPDGEITAVWAGIVGKDGIKPDTFYTLIDGKPEAVK